MGVAPGTLTVQADGFLPTSVVLTDPMPPSLDVTLDPVPNLEEEVVAEATRTATRLADQPLRVEVVDAEEIEEKALMTPGSVAMLAGRDDRPASADDRALAGRGQRASERAARPLHAAAGRWPAALRQPGRLAQPAAGSAARPRPRRDHQGRRLGALRPDRAGRRREPRRAASGRRRDGHAGQRHLAGRRRRDGVSRAPASPRLGVDAAWRVPRTAAARSGRRRLERRARVRQGRRSPAPVLRQRARGHRVCDRRCERGEPAGRHIVGRRGARRTAVRRGARHASRGQRRGGPVGHRRRTCSGVAGLDRAHGSGPRVRRRARSMAAASCGSAKRRWQESSAGTPGCSARPCRRTGTQRRVQRRGLHVHDARRVRAGRRAVQRQAQRVGLGAARRAQQVRGAGQPARVAAGAAVGRVDDAGVDGVGDLCADAVHGRDRGGRVLAGCASGTTSASNAAGPLRPTSREWCGRSS